MEQNRTPCKCLTPVSENLIRELYEEDDDATAAEEVLDSLPRAHEHDASDVIFFELLAKNFSTECKNALANLVEESTKCEWRESILQLFNQCYQDGAEKTDTPSSPQADDFQSIFDAAVDRASQSSPGGCPLPNLELRSGSQLSLKRLVDVSMVPIRAARSSALQTRALAVGGASTSTSTSVAHGASGSGSSIRKAKNDVHIQVMASDNRGRLYVAESMTVLICAAIPAVNARYVDNSPAVHLSRSQLNILGTTASVKFQILGMKICDENTRHLLLWGASRACVAVLSKTLDSFERVIDLKVNLAGETDAEYLVKCDFLSELHVVVVCGTVVHVFDLKRTETANGGGASSGVDDICNATTHYALAYEDVLIRSATLLGTSSDSSITETKLAILLDTGRLYFIALAVDEDGNLEDHGESYIEIGSGLSFPSGGVRRYLGGNPLPEGSKATTFGEGSVVQYLRQSNLLLYQCVSSCCVALILDDGEICGSFGKLRALLVLVAYAFSVARLTKRPILFCELHRTAAEHNIS